MVRVTEEIIMQEIINEHIHGHHVLLLSSGVFCIDGIFRDWYKDSKTGKPFIPKKRSSLIGLIKQLIKEDI